jgi:hypothetical protein
MRHSVGARLSNKSPWLAIERVSAVDRLTDTTELYSDPLSRSSAVAPTATAPNRQPSRLIEARGRRRLYPRRRVATRMCADVREPRSAIGPTGLDRDAHWTAGFAVNEPAAGQPLVQPAPGRGPRSAVPGGLGDGGHHQVRLGELSPWSCRERTTPVSVNLAGHWLARTVLWRDFQVCHQFLVWCAQRMRVR